MNLHNSHVYSALFIYPECYLMWSFSFGIRCFLSIYYIANGHVDALIVVIWSKGESHRVWFICRIIHEINLRWNIVKVCLWSSKAEKATCFWTEPGLTGSFQLKTSTILFWNVKYIFNRQLPHIYNMFLKKMLNNYFLLNVHWVEVSSCILHILLPQLLIT